MLTGSRPALFEVIENAFPCNFSFFQQTEPAGSSKQRVMIVSTL